MSVIAVRSRGGLQAKSAADAHLRTIWILAGTPKISKMGVQPKIPVFCRTILTASITGQLILDQNI